MKVTKEEAYLTLSRYFSKQHESEYEDMVEILYQPIPTNKEVNKAINEIGWLDNNAFKDGVHIEIANTIKSYITQQAQRIKELEEENKQFRESSLYWALKNEQAQKQLQAYKDVLNEINEIVYGDVMYADEMIEAIGVKLKQLSEEK